MRLQSLALAAFVPLLMHVPLTSAQPAPVALPPAANPQALQQWIALDNPRFEALVRNDWPSVQRVLEGFYPPGLTPTPTSVSMGFAGPQIACLEEQAPVACRIYMTDLLRLNQSGSLPGRAGNNPFLPR
jgi:hypothetical protein